MSFFFHGHLSYGGSVQKVRIVDILSYGASGPKYECFHALFDVFASYSSRSMISQSFISIGSDLNDFWPFYGPKFPRKLSFSRYNIQSNSSDSLNRRGFVPNLVFFYSLGTTAIGHGQITNLKKIILHQNRIFLSESFPYPLILIFAKIKKYINY